MPEPIKLDQLLTEFLKYAPDGLVDSDPEGNIIFISNLRLADDKSTLVPFIEDNYDEED